MIGSQSTTCGAGGGDLVLRKLVFAGAGNRHSLVMPGNSLGHVVERPQRDLHAKATDGISSARCTQRPA